MRRPRIIMRVILQLNGFGISIEIGLGHIWFFIHSFFNCKIFLWIHLWAFLILNCWFLEVTTQGRIILIWMCRKAFDLSRRGRSPTSLRWWTLLLIIDLVQACIYFCSLNLVKGCLPWRLLFWLMSAQRRATKSSEVLSLCHSWQTAFESSRILLVLQLTIA